MDVFCRLTRELKDQGRWLAHWLNDGRERDGDKTRVKKILALLQKLQRVLRPGTPIWKIPEVEQVEKALVELTSYYQTWPRFAAESDGRGIGIAHMWIRGSLEESQALRNIEALIKARVLERLAFCAACQTRWIFRSKADLKYCSRQCRQAPYEASAKRQKQKKQHNREYYQRWLKRKRRKRDAKR
jgi:hypothetical protein